ncbi:hypothetical protein MTO96_022578 [Rhipicephalus appendiculatus]
MRDLCDEWHIDEAIVTDGGKNIKEAVRDEFGADKHVSCVAHLLKQVGQATIRLEVRKVPSELETHKIVVVPENEKEAEVLTPLTPMHLTMEVHVHPSSPFGRC